MNKKTLLIFDLNGVLIEKKYSPCAKNKTDELPLGWSRVGGSIVKLRSETKELFDYLFSEEGKTKYDIALWTSAYEANRLKTIRALFPKLEDQFVFRWGQEKCDWRLNPEWKSSDETPDVKPKFFWKCLTSVWREYNYDPNNTLIYDDNAQKLERNPERCNRVIIDVASVSGDLI